MSAPKRVFATFLMTMIGLVVLAVAWAQAPRLLGEGDLIKLLDLQVDDAAILKRIQKGGIDFTVDEATLDRLKKAGASEGVLDAVREAAKARPTVPKSAKAVTYEDILALLRAQVEEQDILDRLAKSPTIFTLGAEQVDELKKAGASEKLLETMQGKRPSAPAGEVTDLAIILDCSGSMGEKTRDNQIKMDVAKRVVSELVHDIPSGLNVTFLIYGHDANLRCKAVKVVRPLDPLDSVGRAMLINAIREFRPVGATPIATALGAAGSELAKGRGPAGLVLISDGKETCGGDPSAETARLVKELKLTFGVHVIGFDVQPNERAALEEIARAGKGQYYNAVSAAKFREVVQVMHKKITVAANRHIKEEPPAPSIDDDDPAVQALIDRLNDESSSTRKVAAESLRRLGAKSAVPALMKRVADDLWYISGYTNVPDDPIGGGKAAALEVLKQLAPDRVTEALIAATRSKTVEVRVWALGELVGRKDDTRADAVVEALVRALGDAGGGDADRAAHMVRAGRHIRRVAAEGLRQLGARSAAPALAQRVADDLWYISGYTNVPDDPIGGGKAAALEVLKLLAPEKVTAALAAALKLKNEYVRSWAAAELGQLRSKGEK